MFQLKEVTRSVVLDIDAAEGKFWISFRKPTFAEAMQHDALWESLPRDDSGQQYARLTQLRLSLVTDWGNVQQANGELQPFSREALENVVWQSPTAFQQITKKAIELLTGTPLGESASVPVSG
ncbi:hypothetical protein Plim_2115 [Planctopirus limnophila DSM 3776]|uniref:Uncharacterized protein n=1 Tax=Planctopirus limnophila (strain ATCC 43296 / DSM 3776 / IFAM 1008 / Mu 290) TaxID=521674 RepID=D5SMN7_PLAL2|nr:hypothetical protein [Planctopirus limnophila]ADG67942.1 hypothetical protein Plim_2115 [Planctopirus limnophila DSM 3776]